jgi:hypothetical protein
MSSTSSGVTLTIEPSLCQAEYHAPCGLAVGLQFMNRRAMGMAMDQPLHVMPLHRVNYRLWIYIHNVH